MVGGVTEEEQLEQEKERLPIRPQNRPRTARRASAGMIDVRTPADASAARIRVSSRGVSVSARPLRGWPAPVPPHPPAKIEKIDLFEPVVDALGFLLDLVVDSARRLAGRQAGQAVRDAAGHVPGQTLARPSVAPLGVYDSGRWIKFRKPGAHTSTALYAVDSAE
jgi:hypothetical protein